MRSERVHERLDVELIDGAVAIGVARLARRRESLREVDRTALVHDDVVDPDFRRGASLRTGKRQLDLPLVAVSGLSVQLCCGATRYWM